ncbi:MAG: putative toxin-antitoxin system toxin component, PIN family, partial [candidate division WOR-3 bacterium]|nr:putative toxin-antitoxin system toxin component, PIN family [candidate division WOR-3 bacterium]
VTRLVLDTNVLVSALLFRSTASALFDAWWGERFRLAVSEPILDEYARVLEYPKFRLSEREATAIIMQLILPYCDRFQAPGQLRFCSDPDDDKFIHCAFAAHAAALVSGDRAVLSLGPRCGRVAIISVSDARTRYCH